MTDMGIVASVRHRLVTASKATGIPNELLQRRYAFERLLVRMEELGLADDFCLKGAMAFAAVTGDVRRPTRDMDMTGRVPAGERDVLETWRAIAAHVPSEPDGMTFLDDTFRSERIQSAADEPGVRITGEARIGTAKVPLKVEISYGNAITPGAVVMDYPTVLEGSRSPRILCYSKETMLAEKFEAACSLGVRTSRFKDFYDIRGLARSVAFDGALVAEAFRNTFASRGTPLPAEDPAVFGEGFLAEGQRGWMNFQRKQDFKDTQTYADLVEEIRPLVMGAAAAALGAESGRWVPGTGWVEAPADEDAAEDGRSFRPF